jgi:hypothetical protein
VRERQGSAGSICHAGLRQMACLVMDGSHALSCVLTGAVVPARHHWGNPAYVQPAAAVVLQQACCCQAHLLSMMELEASLYGGGYEGGLADRHLKPDAPLARGVPLLRAARDAACWLASTCRWHRMNEVQCPAAYDACSGHLPQAQLAGQLETLVGRLEAMKAPR